MTVSESISYKKATISISQLLETHMLRFAADDNSVNIGMTTEQLLELSEVVEWYLFKKESPAATLEEILEGLG